MRSWARPHSSLVTHTTHCECRESRPGHDDWAPRGSRSIVFCEATISATQPRQVIAFQLARDIQSEEDRKVSGLVNGLNELLERRERRFSEDITLISNIEPCEWRQMLLRPHAYWEMHCHARLGVPE